jgi:hypothetical protein
LWYAHPASQAEGTVWNPDTGWQQVNEPVRIHYLS